MGYARNTFPTHSVIALLVPKEDSSSYTNLSAHNVLIVLSSRLNCLKSFLHCSEMFGVFMLKGDYRDFSSSSISSDVQIRKFCSHLDNWILFVVFASFILLKNFSKYTLKIKEHNRQAYRGMGNVSVMNPWSNQFPHKRSPRTEIFSTSYWQISKEDYCEN